MKRLSILSWCLSLMLLPAASHAQILVDKSPPDNINAYFSSTSSPQYIANPFSLSSSATVAGFNFWGVYGAGAPPSPFVVNFFSNAAGQPGSLLSTTSATLTGTLTGGMVGTLPVYRFQLALTPFSLLAGNYWVSVYDTSASQSFAWATSSQTGTIAFSTSAPTGPWSSFGGTTLAFQILGPGTNAVPESGASTGLLLCVALVSLFALKRVRRAACYVK